MVCYNMSALINENIIERIKDLFKSESISDFKNILIDREIFNATLLMCLVHVECLFKNMPKN